MRSLAVLGLLADCSILEVQFCRLCWPESGTHCEVDLTKSSLSQCTLSSSVVVYCLSQLPVTTDNVRRPSAAVVPVCNADFSATAKSSPPCANKPLDRRKLNGQISSTGESR